MPRDIGTWSLDLISSFLNRVLELIAIDSLRIIYYTDAKNHRN